MSHKYASGLSDSLFLTFLRTHGRLKPDSGVSLAASDSKLSAEIDVGAEVCITLPIAACALQLVGSACVLHVPPPPSRFAWQVTNMAARHEAVKLGAEKGFVVRMQCVPKRFVLDSL